MYAIFAYPNRDMLDKSSRKIQDIWKFKYQTGFYCVILSNFNDTVTIQSFLRLARATTIDVCCCVLCCVMWGQVQTNCVAYTFKWYHTRSKNTALAFIRYVIFVINYFVCNLLTVRLHRKKIPLWYIHIKSGSMYNIWNPQRYIILGQLTHAIHDIINTTSFHSREIIYA